MIKPVQKSSGTANYRFDGWKRQPVDVRDRNYSIRFPLSYFGAVATKADNRGICPPIVDQGLLGSCTANAFGALVEANQNRRLALARSEALTSGPSVVATGATQASDGSILFSVKVTPSVSAPLPKPTNKLVRASRLFTYYATRIIEGTVSEDSGATIRNTIKSGARYGAVDEALWGYDITKFAVNPPQPVWSNASLHKVTSYHAIANGDLNTMKAVLSAPIPFLIEFGFDVYDYFLSYEMATKGLLGLPSKRETLQGGHAVALVGYDDSKAMPDNTKGAFLVRNSWGTNWGLQGYFWMSYAYVKNPLMCSDFWVVKSAPLNPS